EALKAFPLVNSRIEGSDIVTPTYCDVGVAVSTERGLMVPIVRDADKKSFAEIEKAIAELAEKARDGKITVEDLPGGTLHVPHGRCLRISLVPAAAEPAADRHPGDARHPEAARRGGRPDRDSADDVPGAVVRSSSH